MATLDRYPPGPRSFWPGGQMFAFCRDAIGFYTGLAREYGDAAPPAGLLRAILCTS